MACVLERPLSQRNATQCWLTAVTYQAHGLTVSVNAACPLNAIPLAYDGDILVALLQYANAHAWYKNLDKLIHYINADGRLNVFYSRSGCLTAIVAKTSLPPCVAMRVQVGHTPIA